MTTIEDEFLAVGEKADIAETSVSEFQHSRIVGDNRGYAIAGCTKVTAESRHGVRTRRFVEPSAVPFLLP